jgi:hypothetical protein
MANYDAIATRVMRGDFGNGQDRKNRLAAAGYTAAEITAIQQRVNQMFYGAPVPAAPAPVAPASVATVATPTTVVTPPPVVVETPPPPAIPPVPSYGSSAMVQPVKYANAADVVTDRNTLPEELMLKLTLEKIGGIELISLVRHDTVNGQRVIYQPVKNLSELGITYSPQSMVQIPDTSELYFKNFAIKLENHMLQDTNELPPIAAYIDTDGKVIINVFGLKRDYEVEVQMISSGEVFDDTIYEEDIS